MTAVNVADQANAVLSDFPYIARRIDQQKIIVSVTATWPDPVGAENHVTLCYLGIFVDQATEPVPAQNADTGHFRTRVPR
jgi:hypothetical protein